MGCLIWVFRKKARAQHFTRNHSILTVDGAFLDFFVLL
jgi:hypothetical protein